MKKLLISFVSIIFLCNFAFARKQENPVESPQLEKTNFLSEGEAPNSLFLLPPPPQENTAHYSYDIERYNWGKSQRHTERGDTAVADAHISGDGVANAFSDAFGYEINAADTPEIYYLIVGMREDAGHLATSDAKEFYMRRRPYAVFSEDTCLPEDQDRLSVNGSYPSGHTSIGWATALVLAEINPARQNEILKRGLEMGNSRVICGYHFQSDVDAARIMAAAVVARLHANDAFMEQLNKAKAEFKSLSVNSISTR